MARDVPNAHGRFRRWLLVTSVVATAARIPLLLTPLRFREDIWRQADTASMARIAFERGYDLFHPAILWGGDGPGYVESELPIVPWLASLGYRVLGGEHVIVGRLVSLVAFFVASVALGRLAERVLGERAARWTVGFFVVSPIAIRESVAFMPDMTALALAVVAAERAHAWLDERRPGQLVAASVAMATAMLAKPPFAVFLVVLMIAAAVRERRLVTSWRAVALVAGIMAPLALWLVHGRQLHEEYGNTFGVISGGDRKLATVDLLLDPATWTGLVRIELEWVLGVAALVPLVVGLVCCARQRIALPLIGFIVAAGFEVAVARYSATDAGIQYHAITLPFEALAIGVGAVALIDWIRERRPGAVPLVGAAAAIVFAPFVVVPVVRFFNQGGRDEVRCAERLAEVSDPDDLVVVASDSPAIDEGFPNNYENPVVFFYADRRGWSMATDERSVDNLRTFESDGARWYVDALPNTRPEDDAIEAHLASAADAFEAPDGCTIVDLAAL